jgi:hypothetical protein
VIDQAAAARQSAVAVADEDFAALTAQLGRRPRGVRAIAHQCSCGLPDVVETRSQLEDGTPFPTLYYLTCPRACSAVGRLEAAGVMREMTGRLAEDAELADAYRRAHRKYVRRRDGAGSSDGADSGDSDGNGVSAGGMPERVKCLHVLVAYELAVPGSNPFGREALDLLAVGSRPAAPDSAWGGVGRCVGTGAASP